MGNNPSGTTPLLKPKKIEVKPYESNEFTGIPCEYLRNHIKEYEDQSNGNYDYGKYLFVYNTDEKGNKIKTEHSQWNTWNKLSPNYNFPPDFCTKPDHAHTCKEPEYEQDKIYIPLEKFKRKDDGNKSTDRPCEYLRFLITSGGNGSKKSYEYGKYLFVYKTDENGKEEKTNYSQWNTWNKLSPNYNFNSMHYNNPHYEDTWKQPDTEADIMKIHLKDFDFNGDFNTDRREIVKGKGRSDFALIIITIVIIAIVIILFVVLLCSNKNKYYSGDYYPSGNKIMYNY